MDRPDRAAGPPGDVLVHLGGARRVSDRSLIQAGTEADARGGTVVYSAWWEILPALAVMVRAIQVRAGDTITVTIARVSSGRWRTSIVDSRGGTFTTTRSYGGAAPVAAAGVGG